MVAIRSLQDATSRRQYPRVPIALTPRKLIIDIPEWVHSYFSRTFPDILATRGFAVPSKQPSNDSATPCAMHIVTSTAPGSAAHHSRIENLSLGGCLIEGPVPLPRGTTVSLEIPLCFSTVSVITATAQSRQMLVSTTDSVFLSSLHSSDTNPDSDHGVLYSLASSTNVAINVWGQTVRTVQKKSRPSTDDGAVPLYTSGCRFTQMSDDDHKLLTLFLQQRAERPAALSVNRSVDQLQFVP